MANSRRIEQPNPLRREQRIGLKHDQSAALSRQHAPRPLSLRAVLRRALVRLRTSPFSVPMLLLLVYAGLMIGLTRVADSWIVALAITPLVFASVDQPGLPARLPAGFLRVSSPGLASLLLPIDAFDTSTHQVMGRRVAGSSFAQGLAASLKPGDQLSMFTGSQEALPALQDPAATGAETGAQVSCMRISIRR